MPPSTSRSRSCRRTTRTTTGGCKNQLARLELRGKRPRAVPEQADVGADGHELAAPCDVAARLRLVSGEDAGRLARLYDARCRVLDRSLHLGMSRLADETERSGQVRRPNEHAVNARHRSYLVELT